VDLNAQRFATVKPQFQGARIDYGITSVQRAAPVEARCSSPSAGSGGTRYNEAGLPPMFDPARVTILITYPPALQVLCTAAVTLDA